MCLTLLQNPKHNYAAMAADLSVGTWFIDDDRQIYVVVHNDRTEDPLIICLLYTSPSPRDLSTSRMPSSA